MFDALDAVEALAVLNAEQLYVIAALFWDDCTEEQTAAELTQLRHHPYNRNRIHRIKLTALAKMRRHLTSQEVPA